MEILLYVTEIVDYQSFGCVHCELVVIVKLPLREGMQEQAMWFISSIVDYMTARERLMRSAYFFLLFSIPKLHRLSLVHCPVIRLFICLIKISKLTSMYLSELTWLYSDLLFYACIFQIVFQRLACISRGSFIKLLISQVSSYLEYINIFSYCLWNCQTIRYVFFNLIISSIFSIKVSHVNIPFSMIFICIFVRSTKTIKIYIYIYVIIYTTFKLQIPINIQEDD